MMSKEEIERQERLAELGRGMGEYVDDDGPYPEASELGAVLNEKEFHRKMSQAELDEMQGEGPTQWRVGYVSGRVVMVLDGPQIAVHFRPDEAKALARDLLGAANPVGRGRKNTFVKRR